MIRIPMRLQLRQFFRILLIFISLFFSFPLIGQERPAFYTSKVDSICRNTLDYIRIKQTLTLQLYEVNQDLQHIDHTIEVMNQHLEQTQNEKSIIESELEAVTAAAGHGLGFGE